MNKLVIAIPESELLASFPAAVRMNVAAMETAGTEWNRVGELLAGAPTVGVALKGSSGFTDRLWSSVKSEFRQFMCGDANAYSDLRATWGEYEKKGAKAATHALSAAIGAQVGMAGAVLAPVVIWLLLVSVRIGKNALCKALTVETPVPVLAKPDAPAP